MARELACAILETDRRREFRAYARTALALAALQEGDREEIERQFADELLIGPCYLSIWAMMAMDRVRALCAAALGRHDVARSYFESAYNFCRKAGYRPELAWTCYDYAVFLLERNTDETRARALLEEGSRTAGALEMRPLVQRIQQLRSRAGAVSGCESSPDSLTQREIDVVRLAAVGKANKEIAAELAISYHTVVNHLKSIYRKTGVHSRAALATYAARLRLGDPSS